eukprot:TRINITY_DN14064_c0_g1_i1.p1 TRINITY_DN14064_c0_g1~~TRINITY_DN14064_c0_g1_i1.p1  ORF type:complete len:516 (+),score=140.23 TRINITY_DN14064_c0_g1_i1:134-1681(+)
MTSSNSNVREIQLLNEVSSLCLSQKKSIKDAKKDIKKLIKSYEDSKNEAVELLKLDNIVVDFQDLQEYKINDEIFNYNFPIYDNGIILTNNNINLIRKKHSHDELFAIFLEILEVFRFLSRRKAILDYSDEEINCVPFSILQAYINVDFDWNYACNYLNMEIKPLKKLLFFEMFSQNKMNEELNGKCMLPLLPEFELCKEISSKQEIVDLLLIDGETFCDLRVFNFNEQFDEAEILVIEKHEKSFMKSKKFCLECIYSEYVKNDWFLRRPMEIIQQILFSKNKNKKIKLDQGIMQDLLNKYSGNSYNLLENLFPKGNLNRGFERKFTPHKQNKQWSYQEEVRLLRAVELLNEDSDKENELIDWNEVQTHIIGRTDNQCLEKYEMAAKAIKPLDTNYLSIREDVQALNQLYPRKFKIIADIIKKEKNIEINRKEVKTLVDSPGLSANSQDKKLETMSFRKRGFRGKDLDWLNEEVENLFQSLSIQEKRNLGSHKYQIKVALRQRAVDNFHKKFDKD